MSRLTTAQIIGAGEYLEPDFNPSTLTVSQLLGVLGYHNVNYPTPYSKPKLVRLFEEEITSRSTKLKRERLKKQNSQASDEGITDGVTGKLLSESSKSAAPERRVSRRLSHVPAEEEEVFVARPDPPKRRRSSAQPNLGGPSSRKTVPTQPVLAEESEPDEDEIPMRKVVRSKKTAESAGVQARRVSKTPAEDSGWEDNNIFQSGAESSSPIRPSPVRKARKSTTTAPRKSRKSLSAPPQLLPSSSPPKFPTSPDGARFSPPQSRFNPQLPSEASPVNKRLAAMPILPKFSPHSFNPKAEDFDELNVIDGTRKFSQRDVFTKVEEDEEDELEPVAEELATDDDDVPEPPRTPIVAASSVYQLAAADPKARDVNGSRPLPLVFRLLVLLGALGLSIGAYNFKQVSASIGYCDAGRDSNYVLEELRSTRAAVDACNRENRTLLYQPSDSSSRDLAGEDSHVQDQTLCPLPPLLRVPLPESCTPCPDHATCEIWTVTCDSGYILRQNPLLFLLPPVPSPHNISLSLKTPPTELISKLVAETTDGLPGLGSVAFPPSCIQDPKRKRHIGALEKAIEAFLGQERGARVCSGTPGPEISDSEGGDAKRWGVSVDDLRDVIGKKIAARQTTLPTSFNDTFNEAIQNLIQWGGVIIGEDSAGNRYLAHKTPDFDWSCAITVKVREIWARWRATVLAVAILISTAFYGRTKRVQKQIESKRVAELVQIALDTLRNQELAHHTDPITVPQPYLSSLQLRDLILQDEHSIPTRRRLWNQVEAVVEGNANVRANLEEIQGGDEMRVWRWVGSAGSVRKRVQPIE